MNVWQSKRSLVQSGIQIHGSKLVFLQKLWDKNYPEGPVKSLIAWVLKLRQVLSYVCALITKNICKYHCEGNNNSALAPVQAFIHWRAAILRVKLQLCSFLLQTCRVPCKALRICPNHKRARGFSLLCNFKESARLYRCRWNYWNLAKKNLAKHCRCSPVWKLYWEVSWVLCPNPAAKRKQHTMISHLGSPI